MLQIIMITVLSILTTAVLQLLIKNIVNDNIDSVVGNCVSLVFIGLIGWGMLGGCIPVRTEDFTAPYKLVKTSQYVYIITELQHPPLTSDNIVFYTAVNESNVVFKQWYNMYGGKVGVAATIK